MANVPITEEFDSATGQLSHYETPLQGGAVREQILDRSHKDIRSFAHATTEIPQSILTLDAYTMTNLLGKTMASLNADEGGTIEYRSGEDWAVTGGTISTSPATLGLGNRPGLTITLGGIGTAYVSSIITPPAIPVLDAPRELESIDLSDGFKDTDHISVSLTALTLANLTVANCRLEFASGPSPNFTSGPVVSIPWSAAAIPITDVRAELRFLRSVLDDPTYQTGGFDKTDVTGVRLVIVATAATTVKVSAIRLLSANWQSTAYDIDTRSQRLEPSVSRVGNTTFDFAFPTQLLRANTPSNQDDPRPIDARMAVAFHSGSLTASTAANQVTLYFRERQRDLMTQLDLEPIQTLVNNLTGITATDTVITVDSTAGFADSGTILIDQEEIVYSSKNLTQFLGCLRGQDGTTAVAHPDNSKVYQGYWQDQLNELGEQPNLIAGGYGFRTMADLDVRQQDELDEMSQSLLERIPDLAWQAYVYAKFTWGPGASSWLEISDTETTASERYRFEGIEGIEPNTDYILIAEIVENSFRAKLYELDTNGNIRWDRELFDSTLIKDEYMFKRTKGRIGWSTILSDGDAALWGIRTHSLNFAEYRSQIFESITPVKGAELTVGGSSDIQLWTGFEAGPWGGSVDVDFARTNSSDGSYRIVNDGTQNHQGIQTNTLPFEDFNQAEITFDVWFPGASASLAPLEVALVHNESRIAYLSLGPIQPDHWSKVRIRLDQVSDLQTGSYRLALFQVQKVPTVWWIDNIRVIQRAIGWYGRVQAGTANHPGRWTPFEHLVNTPGDGVLFPERGRELQVRGKAFRQDAFISAVSVKPQYAELGRLVWTEDRPSPVPGLVPDFALTSSGRTVKTTPNVIAIGSSKQVAQVWSFGDGGVSHESAPTYTFSEPGIYRVTLTAIDDYGREAVTAQDISIA